MKHIQTLSPLQIETLTYFLWLLDMGLQDVFDIMSEPYSLEKPWNISLSNMTTLDCEDIMLKMKIVQQARRIL